MDWENQQMLERFFNARQTPALLRHELLSSPTVQQLLEDTQLDEAFALDLMVQMALRKRAHPSTLIGLLQFHFEGESRYQACADALLIAAEENLVDFDPEKDQFIVRFYPDVKTEDLMRQYQYLPPMIVPPLEVTSNRGSGYLTIADDSLLLRDNHHEGDLCLDSINRFNQVPLSVNTNVIKGIRNSWKNLDKPKTGESFEDYQTRVKAFERYERDSFFTIALVVEVGNRFHLTHKPDKRGRTYCQGYHVSYQGNTWNKSCIELADQEVVET